MISPGTVAAIAGSMMGQGMHLGESSDLWLNKRNREAYVSDYVRLAWEIALEAERQNPNQPSKPEGKKP